MIHIYLTRHGETKWNVEKRLQGWKNSDLTEKGIENAYNLSDRIKDIEFSAIYTSTSQRAYETAKILKGKRDIQIIEEDGLKEVYLGLWEGKTQAEIAEEDKENFDAFYNAPHIYNHLPHGGENLKDFKSRVENVINDIKTVHEQGNILIVTHGVVIKMLMLYFKGMDSIEKLWDSAFIHGTSLTIIEIEKEKYVIKLLGDTSHMEIVKQ